MPSKTKLQQFTEWLNTTASQERSKKNLGPDPIKLLLMANNGILGVWCGQTQPDDIAAGELWFNGQIVKHCTGVNPDVFVPLTTFYADDVKNGYGFFTTEPVSLTPDAGRVSVVSAKLDGSAKLDPASPTGNAADYRVKLIYSDGSSTLAQRPLFSLSDNAPVSFQRVDNGNAMRLTANTVSDDTRIVLTARAEDSTGKPFVDSMEILVKGSKAVSVARVEIVGPDEVQSNATNVRFHLRVYYSDGTFADEAISGYWSISNLSIGRFSSGNREEAGPACNIDMMNHAYDQKFTLKARVVISCDAQLIATKDVIVKANTGMQENQILPYYGKGPAGMRTANFVLGLPGRGEKADRRNVFELELCEGEKGYYAYPVSYGKGQFFDLNTGMSGGWESSPDNMGGDVFEPDTVMVPVGDGKTEPFYVYETDYDGLGVIRFEVR